MNFPFSNNLKLSKVLGRYFAKVEADCLLSENSIIKYKEIAGRLLDVLGNIDVKKIDNDMVTKLKQKLNSMTTGRADQSGRLSSSRKNHFLCVVKNVLKFLEDEGVKVYNPSLIKKFKIPAKQIIYLTKEELQKLINSMREDTITKLRLKTAVICLISSGCRVSELLSLNVEDVDLGLGKAQVVAKGGKLHTLIFNKLAIKYIKKYLAMRAEYINKK